MFYSMSKQISVMRSNDESFELIRLQLERFTFLIQRFSVLHIDNAEKQNDIMNQRKYYIN